MHSQVRVNFTPRKPIASPSTSIYNIKGDFTLIGNMYVFKLNWTFAKRVFS